MSSICIIYVHIYSIYMYCNITVYNVHCIVYSVQCTAYNLHLCIMCVCRNRTWYTFYGYNVQCTMYTVQCITYTEQCTMYTAQCTSYTV